MKTKKISSTRLRKATQSMIKDYGLTLQLLEKYDRRKLPETQGIPNSRNLRATLRRARTVLQES